ncbi:unnamed protein product [Ilex paraguariensis]|uniref:PRA1 family protein n=1 Tax=Ilex paraguariensis TaxID=185542 RepID=A0ABC8SLM8_9AQUA
MLSPSAATATTTIYTTIPISGTDVISRSFQNVSTFLSRSRPWPEFFPAVGNFDHPGSLSGAGLRLKLNSKYFIVNYAIIIFTCATFSLIGVPIALIVYGLIFLLWLVLYIFREDPMAMWGHHVSDRVVTVGLILVSAVAVWFTGALTNLVMGTGAGVLISAIHGVLRNPEGLFLDESDAISNGLIGSRPRPENCQRADFSN